MRRPGSPVSLALFSEPAKMRLYIRNVLYAVLFFFVLTCLKTASYLTGGNAVNIDAQFEKNWESHPRNRRSVLDWSTTVERTTTAPVLSALQEGPLVDLGSSIPARWGSDVFISVKTTHKYHDTRLKDIVDTWFHLAPENTYFFTDRTDPALNALTGGHLINTNCSATHSRQALCCKMGVEFDFFLNSGRSWFCHFDDDNYVNTPELMRMLSAFDPRRDWYLGRPSTRGPIEIIDRDHVPQKISFWFATGGAGFCVSRSLALKMQPLAGSGKFVGLGERIRLPDDVTMGFLIEHLMGKRLTVVDKFHSHLESMKMMSLDNLHDQVSLSAGSYSSQKNVVPVEGYFSLAEDPNHFRSIHCFLYPTASICPRSRLKTPS